MSELATYRRQIREIQEQARCLTEGLNEFEFNWRPGAGQWSIEECLGHLTIMGQWEVHAIGRAIDEGRARGLTGSGPFEYRSLDRFIVDMTRPGPNGMPREEMTTPRRFVPVHGQPVTAILPTFDHVQRQFLMQMDAAEGLDLARIRVATPISRFLKLSLGMVFAQVAAHQQRHLAQARRVFEKLPRGK